MKKLISAVLIIALLFSCLAMPAEAATVADFTDVSPSAWYYEAVAYAAEQGLVSGTSPSTFAPNESITRGQFITILGRKAGVQPNYWSKNDSAFTDVKKTDYFYPHVMWAFNTSVVSGTSDTTFSPGKPISRQEIAKILFGYLGEGKPLSGSNALSAFPDAGSIASWATDAMTWAAHNEILSGSNGKLSPTATATRAQVAQILFNLEGKELINGEDKPIEHDPIEILFSIPAGLSESRVQELLDKGYWASPAYGGENWLETLKEVFSEYDAEINAIANQIRNECAGIRNVSVYDEIIKPYAPFVAIWDRYIQYTSDADYTFYDPAYVRFTGKSEPDANGGYYDYDLANQIMDIINEMRRDHPWNSAQFGYAQPLLWHPRMQEWADIRSYEFSVKYYPGAPADEMHTRLDGSDGRTVGHSIGGENLAFRGWYATAQEVVDGWVDSSLHNANMNDPQWSMASVSCYIKDGKIYASHLFSSGNQYTLDKKDQEG